MIASVVRMIASVGSQYITECCREVTLTYYLIFTMLICQPFTRVSLCNCVHVCLSRQLASVLVNLSVSLLFSQCQRSGVEVYCCRTTEELEQLLKKRKRRASKKNADSEVVPVK